MSRWCARHPRFDQGADAATVFRSSVLRLASTSACTPRAHRDSASTRKNPRSGEKIHSWSVCADAFSETQYGTVLTNQPLRSHLFWCSCRHAASAARQSAPGNHFQGLERLRCVRIRADLQAAPENRLWSGAQVAAGAGPGRRDSLCPRLRLAPTLRLFNALCASSRSCSWLSRCFTPHGSAYRISRASAFERSSEFDRHGVSPSRGSGVVEPRRMASR
jgi:hypothetical protein